MTFTCKRPATFSAALSGNILLKAGVFALAVCLLSFVLAGCGDTEEAAEGSPSVAAPTFSQSDLDRVRDAVQGRDEFWRNYGSEMLRSGDVSHFRTTSAEVSQAWELVRTLYNVPDEVLSNFPSGFGDYLTSFDDNMNRALSLWLTHGYENQAAVARPFADFSDWQERNYAISDEGEAREIYDREASAHYRNDPTRTAPAAALEAMPTQEDIDWLNAAVDGYQEDLRAYRGS